MSDAPERRPHLSEGFRKVSRCVGSVGNLALTLYVVPTAIYYTRYIKQVHYPARHKPNNGREPEFGQRNQLENQIDDIVMATRSLQSQLLEVG